MTWLANIPAWNSNHVYPARKPRRPFALRATCHGLAGWQGSFAAVSQCSAGLPPKSDGKRRGWGYDLPEVVEIRDPCHIVIAVRYRRDNYRAHYRCRAQLRPYANRLSRCHRSPNSIATVG